MTISSKILACLLKLFQMNQPGISPMELINWFPAVFHIHYKVYNFGKEYKTDEYDNILSLTLNSMKWDAYLTCSIGGCLTLSGLAFENYIKGCHGADSKTLPMMIFYQSLLIP